MDTDFVKEVIPFGVGVVLMSPALMLIVRPNWGGSAKFLASFISSLIVGASISFIMGELSLGLPAGVMAIIIDTSAVFTGSQLAYWTIWRPIGARRVRNVQNLTRPAN